MKRIDWVNTAFLFTTPLLAVLGLVYLKMTDGFRWPTILLALVMAIITGIAITGGYHRLFAHKSFDANRLFKAIVLFFGAAAFENSARRWSSDHRKHHKYVDTDLDPYNINRGFFFAHMGWVCLKYDDTAARYTDVPDLDMDPMVLFQDKYIFPLGILFGFILPTAVAALWGDALGGFILAGVVRLVLNHHFTFSINSFCHMIGGQPYSDRNTARDSWFVALFTYGEGYHNFHHKFPSDYRNGIQNYHWDPTKWMVKALSWFGLTSNLRKMPDQTILLARLRMDEKRLVRRLENVPRNKHWISPEIVIAARLKFEETYLHFNALKADYVKLKAEKLNALSQQIAHLNDRVDVMKTDLHRSQMRLQEAMATWKTLCRRLGVVPALASI